MFSHLWFLDTKVPLNLSGHEMKSLILNIRRNHSLQFNYDDHDNDDD